MHFCQISELEILSPLSCAGNWGSGDAILLVSCMCWVCFTITCQIEDHVISLTIFVLFHLLRIGFFSFIYFFCRYVPNELRGGMMGFSFAPANGAILLSVVQVCICAQCYLKFQEACNFNQLSIINTSSINHEATSFGKMFCFYFLFLYYFKKYLIDFTSFSIFIDLCRKQ